MCLDRTHDLPNNRLELTAARRRSSIATLTYPHEFEEEVKETLIEGSTYMLPSDLIDVATQLSASGRQHLRLTQQELADLVGASRSVVSSILNRLRDQGILNYNREYLCVRKFEEVALLIELIVPEKGTG